MPTLDCESQILYWLLVTLDAWGTALIRKAPGDWWAGRYDSPRDNTAAFQYAIFGIPFEPAAWRQLDQAPPPSPAERQAFHRAVESLETAGLIVAVRRHGTKVSHIQPSPKGLVVALKLSPAHREAVKAIEKALSVAKWATPAHLAAIDAAGRPEATADA